MSRSTIYSGVPGEALNGLANLVRGPHTLETRYEFQGAGHARIT